MTRAERVGVAVVIVSAVALVRCTGAPATDAVGPGEATAPAAAGNVITITKPVPIEEDVTTVEPAAEGAPRVVFKVKPGADSSGVIGGFGSTDKPFNVTFNMCASVDPDNDPMLFSIDIDGNGTLDDQGTTGGHCRQTIPYTAGEGETRRVQPTVCVVDLDTFNAPRRVRTCKTYTLVVSGQAVTAPSCGTGPGWLAVGSSFSPQCKCSANGLTFDFFGEFAGMCFANGFGGATWSLASGLCTCN